MLQFDKVSCYHIVNNPYFPKINKSHNSYFTQIFQLQTFSEFNGAVILNLNALLNQIVFNYITCNYASIITEKLSSVSIIVSDSKWYMYPLDVQKLLPLFIQRTQSQYRITGYGVITCSMATYLAVNY